MAAQIDPKIKSIIPHSQPWLTDADHKAVADVLNSGMIAAGALVEQFEGEVSRYLGLIGGVAASSGTDALFLALKSLSVAVGDEVVLPTYVCRAVWDSVCATGATPVLCDIADDWCMNAKTISPHLNACTKAIIVVHTFGIVADVEGICRLGVPVIEDCCQALGAKSKDRLAGTSGALCVLSFHATKLLTTGEGGMALTREPRLLAQLRVLTHGAREDLAVRYRQSLSDLQAALGLSQLRAYEGFLKRRRAIVDYYFAELKGLPVQLPTELRERSLFFRFPLRIAGDFEMIRRAFDQEGVQVRRGVDALLHRKSGRGAEEFPVAERRYSDTVSIPAYPSLSDEDCERVIAACRKVFGAG